MPIYEYECSKCKHKHELLQKMNDAPALVCPHCSEKSLVRLVSAAGFQLKGGGWYETDFKNKPTATGTTSTKSEVVSTTSSNDTRGSDKVANKVVDASTKSDNPTKVTKKEGK